MIGTSMSSSDRNGAYIANERSCGAASASSVRCSVDLKSAPDEKHEPVPVTTSARIPEVDFARLLAATNASRASG